MKNPFSNQPLVSVITTVKNGEKKITKTIQSVLKQDYKYIEYIIIDGGSIDNTIKNIKLHFNDKVNLYVENDFGVYYGMNNAISKSKGDIIAILNCGDVFFNDQVISKVVNLYNTNSNKLSVYNGGISLIGNSGENIRNVIREKQIMYFKYFIMPVNHPAFFVTKEVYKRYGTFNTDFKIAADYELILRFSKNKVNFCFFQDICTVVEPLGLSSYLSNNNELLKEGFLVRSLYLNLFNNKIIDFIIRIILSLSKYKHEYLNKLR